MPLPISALRAMSKHRNVTIIDPETNPHSIIQSARAVVVINSTVGFEALAYEKPVVVLGDWTMRGLGVTFDVENLAELARTLRNAIDAGSVDQQKVHAVFYSLWRSMYDGHYFRSNPDYDALARSIALKAKSSVDSPAYQGKSIAAAAH
jgi:capsule polysaccharide export protein KpsC/LpsZ